MSTREPKQPLPIDCPKCGTQLEEMLFMGSEHDGWVCPECSIYYNDEFKPLARVIG